MEKILTLQQHLQDSRIKQVVFLSHCILNENTRYLGGACRGCCVHEIVEQCIEKDFGIVQMPCPEQSAWGGVMKRFLLGFYGVQGTLVFRFRGLLLPLFKAYTSLVYRRLARAVANQIADYLHSGYDVKGIIGIDGSPTCGVRKTLSLEKSFSLLAVIDIDTITVSAMNAIIEQCLVDGKGLFTSLLQKELHNRQLEITYGAHDLMGEIHGKTADLGFILAFDE